MESLSPIFGSSSTCEITNMASDPNLSCVSDLLEDFVSAGKTFDVNYLWLLYNWSVKPFEGRDIFSCFLCFLTGTGTRWQIGEHFQGEMDGKNYSQRCPNKEHSLSPEKGDLAGCAQVDFIAISELLWPVTVTSILSLYKRECLVYPFPVHHWCRVCVSGGGDGDNLCF